MQEYFACIQPALIIIVIFLTPAYLIPQLCASKTGTELNWVYFIPCLEHRLL